MSFRVVLLGLLVLLVQGCGSTTANSGKPGPAEATNGQTVQVQAVVATATAAPNLTVVALNTQVAQLQATVAGPATAVAAPSAVPQPAPIAAAPKPAPAAVSPATSPSAREPDRQIRVFFSRNPESLDDFSKVFPVGRAAPDAAVASAALKALIAGPTPDEAMDGYFSEISEMMHGPSSCGGADFTIQIDAGLATVRLCRAWRSAGVGQDARVQSTVEATLTQFPTIQRIRLLSSDGSCLLAGRTCQSADGGGPQGAVAQAAPPPEGCQAALASQGTRWDGLPMEHHTTDAPPRELSPLGSLPVGVCGATGPPGSLPASNQIGCLLVRGQLAMTDGKTMCGAFTEVRREGADEVVWIAHNSAATVYLTRFRWNGTGFIMNTQPQLACGDQPLIPVASGEECARLPAARATAPVAGAPGRSAPAGDAGLRVGARTMTQQDEAGARSAVEVYYRSIDAGKLAVAWDLLSPAAQKRLGPQETFVRGFDATRGVTILASAARWQPQSNVVVVDVTFESRDCAAGCATFVTQKWRATWTVLSGGMQGYLLDSAQIQKLP